MPRQYYSENKLIDAVDAKPNVGFVEERGEVVAYYQQEYGEKRWKPELAMSIAGTRDKKSTAYKSAIRQFQKKTGTDKMRYQVTKPTPKEQARYQALGNKLGRVLKGDSISFHVEGKQPRKGGRPPRDRKLDITLTGEQAKAFVNSPNWYDLFDAYGYAFGTDEEGDTYGLDDVQIA